jgi:hypothetical protein
MSNEILSKADKKAYEQWLLLRRRISTATNYEQKESEAEKQKRIKMLLKRGNEFKFFKYYFPHYIDSDFGWFHRKAIDDIRFNNENLHIWEWAREHAKSVFADVMIPLLMKARGKLTGMILGSENEDKAKGLLKDIQAELMDNKRYINDFGEQHIIGSWIQAHFTTASDGIGFWGFGLVQNPAGVRNAEKRPNFGVIDDADSLKLAKNQIRTKEAVDWIKGDFLGCLSITGDSIFIYCNNRVARNGITAHMVGDVEEGDPKNEGINHIKVFALEDANHDMALPGNPDARPAWIERYSYEQITQRMAKMGYRNSLRQFFHLHIIEGNIFTDDHIVFTPDIEWDKYDALVSYNDPSYKDSKKNDFKSIVFMGKRGRYIDILWIWIRQDKKSNMVKAHYDLHERIEAFNASRLHKPITVRHYMEAGFVQDMILEDYEKEGDLRGYQLRIRKDERNKPDKFGRIEDLEPAMARGQLLFVESLRKSKDFVTMKEQFLGFPNGHDDGPDSVEGGKWILDRQTKTTGFPVRMGKMRKTNTR